MNKNLISVYIVLGVLLAAVWYYKDLDNHYYSSKEFYDFPIPKDAKIENENSKSIGYKWKKSTGTEVPLNYRLMIKKSGWKHVDTEGQNVMYKKNEKVINLTLTSNYFDLIKVENSESK